MNNVVPITVRPKEMHKVYKKIEYSITFLPQTKEWKWQVVIESKPMRYGEVCKTQREAMRAAEKFIDKLTAAKGE